MRLRLVDGTVFGGAEAVVEIARRIWWAWPLWALSRLPGAMRIMRAAYGWVARHRSCANGACRLEAPVPRRAAAVSAADCVTGDRPAAPLVAAAMGVHVDDGGRALRRMQMAVVSRRAQPRRQRRPCAHARVSLRLAGHGCRGVPVAAERRAQARRIGMDHRGAQDGFRRCAALDRSAHGLADTSGARRLAGDDRRDLRASLRHVPLAVAGLALRRHQRDAGDAQPAAVDVAGGFLGTPVEYGIS